MKLLDGRWLTAACFAALICGAVLIAAKAYSTVSERDVIYRHINEALTKAPRHETDLQWKSATQTLSRPLRPADEQAVGKALETAWAAYAAAITTGQTGFLPDYFTGTALQRATKAALDGHRENTRMVLLPREARPLLFHLDGSVIQFAFTGLTARFALDEDGLAAFSFAEDGFKTIMVNETDGWRVLSHERETARQLPVGSAPYQGGILTGINYYPALAPWRKFWPHFDPKVIEGDFGLIRDLGANSVRIFLTYDEFIDPETLPGNLQNLTTLLKIADDKGLKVIPTLFDLKPNFDVATWPDDVRFLLNVTSVLQEADNIAFIDIKNEPDLDIPNYAPGLIDAWLRTMIGVIRSDLPETSLTIGWSSSGAADRLIDLIDVVTYHDYADVATATERLQQARGYASGKPVMVTEIGASAWSLLPGLTRSQETQARKLSDRLAALETSDGVFVWTLHDFPEPDATAIGNSTWVQGLQSSFGLFAINNRPKPVVEAVRSGFAEMLKTNAGP